MFKPVSNKLNIAEKEEKILEFWEENKIFEKGLTLKKDAPIFSFYEGPPTANGKPGIHHVMARTVKDVVCRYKTMKGFLVERKAGWDTHGLPVEIEVEKSLNLNGKDDIEKLGVGEFNKRQIWYRLGRFPRMTVFKFTMSDAVKPVFIKLEANIRSGQRGR